MNVRVRRHSVFAVLSGIFISSVGTKAAAQVPVPSGVVTNQRGLDATGKVARRYPVVPMQAATQVRIRALIAAHHPEALSTSSTVSELTFVLGPKQTYMSSVARSASSATRPARIDGGVAFLPSEPRSVEYVTFAAGEVGAKPLRVIVVNVL